MNEGSENSKYTNSSDNAYEHVEIPNSLEFGDRTALHGGGMMNLCKYMECANLFEDYKTKEKMLLQKATCPDSTRIGDGLLGKHKISHKTRNEKPKNLVDFDAERFAFINHFHLIFWLC